jgi:hypothetical protein
MMEDTTCIVPGCGREGTVKHIDAWLCAEHWEDKCTSTSDSLTTPLITHNGHLACGCGLPLSPLLVVRG